ncbi:hypothetical protein [Chitinophaga sp. RAB17]|uniref:hypothetical protein n=1 Tax=Chitinophaga sp. RAB17 TaxID=3233049 RepID=UPI003F90DF1B
MKKAKLALSITAVLAVISGALGFKAKSVHVFYKDSTIGSLRIACSIPISTTWTTTTTTLIPGAFTTYLSTTKDINNPCPVITVKASA